MSMRVKKMLMPWIVGSCVALTSHAALSESTDPFERVNRAVFSFNEVLDTYFLKPIAKGYQNFTPDFFQDRVGDFFGNVGEARNLANNLLQGKAHDAGVDTSRFLLNTTLGGLGLFDVAKRFGLDRNDEDFGQTLGAWGVQSGPYLMLPLLGPSTVRDGFGRIPDSYVSGMRYINDVPVRNSLMALDIVDTRADLLAAERLVTGDKYSFIRNAYLQNREYKVMDGEVEDDF